MDRAELAAWLRLDGTPGLGRQRARQLLAAFASPQAVLQTEVAALAQVVGMPLAEALQQPPPGFDALLDTTWAWLQGTQEKAEDTAEDAGGLQGPGPGASRRITVLGDSDYPAAFLTIEDPPLMLYLLGRPLPGPATGAIAIVGSRNPTPQGLEDAHAFAAHFAAAGLTVVSGLAQGIDGAAHEGALEGAAGSGRCATVAFVGTGLDRVYPRRHLKLAHRIAAAGCLASEYPLGTPPLPHNFPRRNRLIAGLALGTLVVEAAQPSGSLITARVANEQGKDVFAIPGSIHSPMSRGCHALIRQGAKLVESAQDVMEELRLPAAAAPGAMELAADDDAADDPLLEALGWAPAGIEALVARTGMPASTIQVRLLELELDGQVARMTGGLVQRMAKA